MYRPGRGARKLDRKKSKGADGPSSGATGSFPLEAGVSSRKAASSRQSSADLVLARTLFMHACCISGLPSFSLFLPYSWLVPSFRPSSSRSRSLCLPFSRLFLYPIGISSFIGTGRVRDKKNRDKRTRERTAGASSSVYAAR